MSRGKTAARKDEPAVSLGQLERQARADTRPTTARRKLDRVRRDKVDRGVPWLGICGNRELGVKRENANADHAGKLLPSALQSVLSSQVAS